MVVYDINYADSYYHLRITYFVLWEKAVHLQVALTLYIINFQAK